GRVDLLRDLRVSRLPLSSRISEREVTVLSILSSCLVLTLTTTSVVPASTHVERPRLDFSIAAKSLAHDPSSPRTQPSGFAKHTNRMRVNSGIWVAAGAVAGFFVGGRMGGECPYPGAPIGAIAGGVLGWALSRQ